MRITRIVVALLMFSVTGAVNAQATYTYTGLPFDTFSNTNTLGGLSNPYSSANFISGSFTVGSVLADGAYNFSALALQTTNPVNFAMSFSDGVGPLYTFTATNGSINTVPIGWPYIFNIAVGGGNIEGWALLISAPASGNPGGSGHALSSSGGTLAQTLNPLGDYGVVVLGNGFADGGTSQFGSWTSPVAAIPDAIARQRCPPPPAARPGSGAEAGAVAGCGTAKAP